MLDRLVKPYLGRQERVQVTKKPTKWKAFPFGDKAYDYAGADLKKHWPKLHQGGCEPFPDEPRLRRLVVDHPGLEPRLSLKDTARRLQDAWRDYRCGDFA